MRIPSFYKFIAKMVLGIVYKKVMENVNIPIDKRKISRFCKKHHILSLALFGSILSSHFKASSDVDILIKFKKNHIPNFFDLIDIESELSSIIGRQVDLKTPNDLSPYFRSEVISNSKFIYGK